MGVELMVGIERGEQLWNVIGVCFKLNLLLRLPIYHM